MYVHVIGAPRLTFHSVVRSVVRSVVIYLKIVIIYLMLVKVVSILLQSWRSVLFDGTTLLIKSLCSPKAILVKRRWMR